MSAKPRVVRSLRVPADVVATLGAGGLARVHEAQDRTGLRLPRLRPIYPGAAVAGTAELFLGAATRLAPVGGLEVEIT